MIRAFGRGAAIMLGALALAAGSLTIWRFGPDQAIYCALGKSSDGTEIWCPEPVLNAGWPAPFLFDSAGISVERSLSFEDDFRSGPFAADFAFYAVFLGALVRFLRRLVRLSAARRARAAILGE